MIYGTGLYLTSGFLNNEDVGSTLSSGLNYPLGQVGRIIAYRDDVALKLSAAPATRTLFAGLYQVVRFLSTSTASNAVGQAVFWNARASYTVTPDAAASTEGDFAGVALNAVTKGNIGVIQVAGKATVLYRATVTSLVTQNLVLQLTTTNTFDAIADATGSYISGGTLGLKNIVGIALEAPTNGGLKLVSLWGRNLNLF